MYILWQWHRRCLEEYRIFVSRSLLWQKLLALIWAQRTRAWRSWKAASRSCSRILKARRVTPVRRGVHQDRRAAGGRCRQAPGRHQLQEHRLFHQAVHGAQVHRGGRGAQARPLQGRRRLERRRRRRGRGRGQAQAVQPGGDLGDDPGQAEGRRRNAPGREDHPGRHHGAGLLQRLPAPGHQGRRADRRPGSAAHHQRADRRLARLRPGQEEGREDRGVRPGRRHVRYLRAGNRRRRLRGQGHQRRHPPGRRRLGRPDHGLDPGRVQEGARHGPAQAARRAPAHQRGSREGQDRPLQLAGLRDQPAVHYGRRQRAQAHQHEADPRQDGAALRRSVRAHHRPGQELPARRRHRRRRRSTSWCWSAA